MAVKKLLSGWEPTESIEFFVYTVGEKIKSKLATTAILRLKNLFKSRYHIINTPKEIRSGPFSTKLKMGQRDGRKEQLISR